MTTAMQAAPSQRFVEHGDPVAIQAVDLVKDYGKGDSTVHALRHVNVAFEKGRFTAIMGPSGSGKSTLMHTLSGLDSATSGHIMFQGVDHVSRYYDAEAMYAFVNGGKVKEHHLDRWNPAVSEAQNLANARYPLLHYDSYGDHNQRTNSFFLKNGAFFRLKNIELSYSLPEKWIKHAYMSQCRFFVNANNLVTWDHLDGLTDPESNGSNRYPICKTVNFGVNIQF